MVGVKLDRANVSEVQYGIGAPDANTHGRVYYRTDTRILYLKESTTWTPILGLSTGTGHGQMAYWNNPAAVWTLTSLTELYFDESAKKLDVADTIWMIGETIWNMDLSAITASGDIQNEGLVFHDKDTPFPASITLATGVNYDLSYGTWTYRASGGSDEGWYINGLVGGRHEAGGWLWPLNRQSDWEVFLDFHAPDHTGGETSRIMIVGRSPNGLASYFAEVVMTAGPAQYTAYLYTADGAGSWTASYTGSTQNSGSAFQLGLRIKNGCLGIYDDQDDSWHDITAFWGSTAAANTASDLILMTGHKNGETYDPPTFTNLSFKYL